MQSSTQTNRLEHFPIMFFTVSMGFGGLSLAYLKAHEELAIPIEFFYLFRVVTSVVFVVAFLFYAMKFFKYRAQVVWEFSHPIRLHFFPAFSIALLLLSALYSHFSLLSVTLFWLGLIIHTFLTFHTVRFWINNSFEIARSNPAWFIPIVGNLIIPALAHDIHPVFLSYFFALGVFFWLVLFSIIFYRIIFHPQLAQKFMPTLFIFIAPPAIALLGYLNLNGIRFDLLAQMFLNLALFFAFLLIFMYKNFIKLKFFISWWAFTFPLAALSIALIRAFSISNLAPYFHLALLFLIATTIIIGIVSFKTYRSILRQEVCVAEE